MSAPVRTQVEVGDEEPSVSKTKRRSLTERVLPKRFKSGASEAKETTGDNPILSRKIDHSKLDPRRRLDLLMNNPKSGRIAKYIIGTNIFMIQLSVLNFFCDTIPSLRQGPVTRNIETVVNVFFTLESCARTYIGTMNPVNMIVKDPTYWVDILCLVPFYVTIITEAIEGPGAEMHTAIRFMQLLRLVRIIKLFRHCT